MVGTLVSTFPGPNVVLLAMMLVHLISRGAMPAVGKYMSL